MTPVPTAEPLALRHFLPLLGQRFVLKAAGVDACSARLVEAAAAGGAPFDGREPFSLLFVGPARPLLPQRIYRVEHPLLQPMDIFLVPLRASGDGVCYEAIFN